MATPAEQNDANKTAGSGFWYGSEDDEMEAGPKPQPPQANVQQSTEAYLRFLVEAEAKRENQTEDVSFKQTFLTDILELGATTSQDGDEPRLCLSHSGSNDRLSDFSNHSVEKYKDHSAHGANSSTGDRSGHGTRGERSMERLIAETVSGVAKKRKLGLSSIWIPEFGRLVTAKVFQKFTSESTEGLHFFGERCAELHFKYGEGLPGRVWKSGLVEWCPDVTQLTLDEYPRLEIAKACGVRATCAIPFVVCGSTLAVLELVMSEVKDRDEELIAEVQTALTTALAMKVNQGAAMNTLPRNNSRDNLASMMQQSEKYLDRPLHLRAISEQWAIARKELVLGEKIGEGQEGVVYKASWRGMTVVAKSMKLNDKLTADDHHEVSVLSHLRHPNLVLFLGACVDAEPVWVVSEFMEGGSLQDMFDQKAAERGGKRWRPPAREVLKWGGALARALCFLHNCAPPIIHRDLKPGNLLLSADGQLKIADFGLSKIVRSKGTQSGAYMMTGLTGTPRYMAPEVLLSKDYNEKVDVYSFGLVLWLVATGGELPLESEINMMVARAGPAGDVATLLAEKLYEGLRPDLRRITLAPLAELMAKAWASNPVERPQAVDMIEELKLIEEKVGSRGGGKKVSTRGDGTHKPGKQCAVS